MKRTPNINMAQNLINPKMRTTSKWKMTSKKKATSNITANSKLKAMGSHITKTTPKIETSL